MKPVFIYLLATVDFNRHFGKNVFETHKKLASMGQESAQRLMGLGQLKIKVVDEATSPACDANRSDSSLRPLLSNLNLSCDKGRHPACQ